ncbi:unnamed protein product, partial [Rotaria sp. Silwood1]
MALDKRILAVASVSAMIVACIFYIVSNALPSWASTELGSREIDLTNNHLAQYGLTVNDLTQLSSIKVITGLWRGCVSISERTKCIDLPSSCSLARDKAAAS